MIVNIEIVFLEFLKNGFSDLRGLWFERQYGYRREKNADNPDEGLGSAPAFCIDLRTLNKNDVFLGK